VTLSNIANRFTKEHTFRTRAAYASARKRFSNLLAGAALISAAWPALAASSGQAPMDLTGKASDPFASHAAAEVFLFVRTDCPITNRYAPELQRLAREYEHRNVRFWMIYPDATETTDSIRTHIRQYSFPGTPLRDPGHQLVKRARVTIAPEAAVFDAAGTL
jgi:AhpC/TSA family